MTSNKTYRFSVREVIEREATVTAPNAAEARRLLRMWGDQNHLHGGLAEHGGPISLSDINSLRFTFRSLRTLNDGDDNG